MEPMKSKAPQLHLEYRFYKLLGSHGKTTSFTSLTLNSLHNVLKRFFILTNKTHLSLSQLFLLTPLPLNPEFPLSL